MIYTMNNQQFGFKDGDLEEIIRVLELYPLEAAIIFGSRAKGTYKNGSDVDIALKGENLDVNTINQISYQLNEVTDLPYMFDVLNYHTLTNPALIEHIDRVGIVFYNSLLPLYK